MRTGRVAAPRGRRRDQCPRIPFPLGSDPFPHSGRAGTDMAPLRFEGRRARAAREPALGGRRMSLDHVSNNRWWVVGQFEMERSKGDGWRATRLMRWVAKDGRTIDMVVYMDRETLDVDGHPGSSFETDNEHMVAASEAHDSGLCAAHAATKRRFAGDLLNLARGEQTSPKRSNSNVKSTVAPDGRRHRDHVFEAHELNEPFPEPGAPGPGADRAGIPHLALSGAVLTQVCAGLTGGSRRPPPRRLRARADPASACAPCPRAGAHRPEGPCPGSA